MKTNAHPYGIDLRKKVITFLKSGNSQRSAAKVFSISKTTVNNWYKMYQKEGHCTPKKRLGAKPKIDTTQFVDYITKNPNATTFEIGKVFDMTYGGAHYWLRKLGFNYKKKPLPTWKLAQQSERNI
jgi:transposase